MPLTVTLPTFGLLASLTNTATLRTSNANNKRAKMELTPNAEVDFATQLQKNVFHVTLELHAVLAMLANVTLHAWKLLAPWILNALILLKIATPLMVNASLKDALLALIAEQTLVILPLLSALRAPRLELQLSTVPQVTTAKTQHAWFKDLAAPTTAPALTSPKLVTPLLDSAKFNPGAQTQEAADQTFATQALATAKLAQSLKDQLTPLETALLKLLMMKTNTMSATQPLESARLKKFQTMTMASAVVQSLLL